MNSPKDFDKDYYQNGRETHKSLYENYRWIPQISFEISVWLQYEFPGCSILDFGCAYGYVVKALRLLDMEAWGYDISPHAIQNSNEWCNNNLLATPDCDVVFAKDVLEHIPYEQIDDELSNIKEKGKQFFFIIPLGDNGVWRIAEYDADITHEIKEDEEWWLRKFKQHKFHIRTFDYNWGALKKKWTDAYPYGNGFFLLDK